MSTTADVVYITKDFDPVEADDPRVWAVKVRQEDGKIVFGFPKRSELSLGQLLDLGGPGSGYKKHPGRPGEEGGSLPRGVSRKFYPTGAKSIAGNPLVGTVEGEEQVNFYAIRKNADEFFRARPESNVMFAIGGAHEGTMLASDAWTFHEAMIEVYDPEDKVDNWVRFGYGNMGEDMTFTLLFAGVPNMDFEFVEKQDVATARNNVKRAMFFLRKAGYTGEMLVLDNDEYDFAWSIGDLLELGGPTSGNYQHEGRPGQVGGSKPSGKAEPDGGAAPKPAVATAPSKMEDSTSFARKSRRFDVSKVPGSSRRSLDHSKKIHEQMSQEFSEWEEQLTEQEEKALDGYANEDYADINEALRRDGGRGVSQLGTPWLRDQIEVIDGAISRSPGFAEDTVVYRGIDHNPGFVLGDSFLDRGFASASMDSQASEEFALLDTHGAVMLEINVPKNFPAAYISKVAGNAGELEVLLPRNVEFMVANKYIRTSSSPDFGTHNITVFQLEVIDVYDDADLEE